MNDMKRLPETEYQTRCDQYIDMHPGETVTAAALAEHCGYSLQHFCLLFRSLTGMTPAEYVHSRRLRRASGAIADGQSITTAAMDAGFQTNAGFTKLFKREYGISPQEYRRRVRLGNRNLLPCPDIRHCAGWHCVGYRLPETLPDPDSLGGHTAGARWQMVDFHAYPKYPADMPDYGEVGVWQSPDPVTGEMPYFFGCVTDWTGTAEGFSSLELSAGIYAVFSVSDMVATDTQAVTVSQMRQAWGMIFEGWLPSSDARSWLFDGARMCFEMYVKSQAWIYIPVREAEV